jgi:SAM-dependent methyltransferase
LGIQFNRLPSPKDWSNDDFISSLQKLNLGVERGLHNWEQAFCLASIENLGLVKPSSRAASVAAGREPLLFYLSNHVSMVWAVDLYQGKWRTSPRDFPSSPSKYSTIPFDQSRLQVARMDATSLGFNDEVFDFTYCLGPSINYFGGFEGAVLAIRELERITKPGGFVLASSVFVEGETQHPFFYNKYTLFTELLGKTGLKPVDSVSVDFSELAQVVPASGLFAKRQEDPGLVIRSRVFSRQRHSNLLRSMILNVLGPFNFTSIMLVLRKPG